MSTKARQPTSPTSKRNHFRRIIDPLPLHFPRRDPDLPNPEFESEAPKPRRSLSFPSSSSPNEHSGLKGMGIGGGTPSTGREYDKYEMGYERMADEDEDGLDTAAEGMDWTTSGSMVEDDDKLENGHASPNGAVNGRTTLRGDGNNEMLGKDLGQENRTVEAERGTKGGKSYVNGSRELPLGMQGEGVAAGDEIRPGYGIGCTEFKSADRSRQLLTPVLSPGGPNLHGQRRSSVAGPVTGLGVTLRKRETPPSEIGSGATSPGSSLGTGGEASGRLTGQNNRPGDVSPRLDQRKTRVRKLSSAKMHELTSSPESTVLRALPSESENFRQMSSSSIPSFSLGDEDGPDYSEACIDGSEIGSEDGRTSAKKGSLRNGTKTAGLDDVPELPRTAKSLAGISSPRERQPSSRTASSTTDASVRRRRSSVGSKSELLPQPSSVRSKSGRVPKRMDLDASKNGHFGTPVSETHPSPMPPLIPLPPLSVPTYLQLELSSNRPSPLYIHQSVTNDFPYESSRAKIERLQNFLLLPPQLEQVLWFGAFACLDAWLYSFTILPLRFLKALFILFQSWAFNIGVEIQFVSSFVFEGVRRVWRRRQKRRSTLPIPADLRDADEVSRSRAVSVNTVLCNQDASLPDKHSGNRTTSGQQEGGHRRHGSYARKHRRNKSTPSTLVSDDKADILKGSLMVATCCILMYFDASRMYHWIRGQAAIKLYVIYNVLEVRSHFFSR